MPVVDRRSYEADLAACRALLCDGSKSFHTASLLLPRRVRDDATALYAFCRLADDAVDLAPRSAPALARLHERLALAYAGQPLDIPADRAFARMVAQHAMPRALPEALLEGFLWDAEGRHYETIESVHAYGARVAGSVGAMMALLMGARDAASLARAADLGVAMQLSNIARDVGEDARAGRLYLPRAWLREAGIDPAAWLAQPVFSVALGGVVRRLLAEAERLYRRAESGIGGLPLACRPGIGAARLIYAEIGRKVASADFDSVTQRAVVPKRRKLALLGRSLGLAVLPPRPDPAPPLAANRFLVAAALSAPPPRAVPGFADRAVAMVELFARLERADWAPGAQSLRRGGA